MRTYLGSLRMMRNAKKALWYANNMQMNLELNHGSVPEGQELDEKEESR